MTQPPELVGTATSVSIAPKGHLILGQAKLTIPLKNGVRIPLSVTFANRTELIKEEEVRANVGLTFDWMHSSLHSRHAEPYAGDRG